MSEIPSRAGQEGESAEAFYHRVFRSLLLIMVALVLAGTPAFWIRSGRGMALSFLAGGVIAIVNFHWLRRSVEAMGAQLETTGATPSRAGAVARFLLRYFLIAAAGYVILRGTTNSLFGLLAGLSVPVGAILIEAVIETGRALRAGF